MVVFDFGLSITDVNLSNDMNDIKKKKYSDNWHTTSRWTRNFLAWLKPDVSVCMPVVNILSCNEIRGNHQLQNPQK